MKKNNHTEKLTAFRTMPIIGVGASAGGLEAFEDFFKHMPSLTGMAFVVVQHLDPTKHGMLPELLQRITTMSVVEAGNRMNVQPNCVYVIPPNKDLSIIKGTLFLLEPSAPRGLRLPIDFFFGELAKDQQEDAVGVVLSGMGSDGTIGLRSIKEAAGFTFAQSPESAQYNSMPLSAINSGFVDIVGTAQELPGRIITCIQHTYSSVPADKEFSIEIKSRNALQHIITLLKKRNGNDFTLYKKNTIYRRIERRMLLHKVTSITTYANFLRENPQEMDLLFKELLIGVTSFFRDPEVWEQLRIEALPNLLAANQTGKEMRAWVPACSTGEEAYSLAIMFKETLHQINPQGRFSLQIFATDLDEDAISFARQGLYPTSIQSDVPPNLLDKYFIKDGNNFRIHKDIREMVIFAEQNIIMDPPFTKLDILTCRNLLIYFGTELQKKIIPMFHYALNKRSFMILGNAETIGGYQYLFSAIDNKSRIYNRIDQTVSLVQVEFPTRIFPIVSVTEYDHKKEGLMSNKSTKIIPNLQILTDQVLLQGFTPAAVLVNNDGDILYINGHTGKYLEPAAGKANWNVYAMAREGLRHELGIALSKAQKQTEPVFVPRLSIGFNGGKQYINLTVQTILNPEALRGTVLIVFEDLGKQTKVRRRIVRLDQKSLLDELERAQEQIQAKHDEMQTSQEELKSTNEELQSTNEELQSTNEELTTSKEEMQSLNEELQTVNAELLSKVDDLSWVNNDMKNLLNSTEIATIFLDNELKLRRFTPHVTHLFKLIPTDIGRPLSDIVNKLDYSTMQEDAVEVLRTLVFVENQISANDDRWFKVRIMPYRTQDNVINGVVMTFTEISDFKKLEKELLTLRSQHK